MCMVLHLSLQTSSNDGRIELESNNAGVTVAWGNHIKIEVGCDV